MKIYILIIFFYFSFKQVQSQSDDEYYLPYHQIFIKVNNATKAKQVLYYSNYDRKWIRENSTNFFIVSDFRKGLVQNQTMNKTAFVFTNDTLEELFYQEDQTFNINTTILDEYKDADMLVVEIPDEIINKFDTKNNSFSQMTIFLSSKDIQDLVSIVDQSQNQTISTYFYSFNYLNCEKLAFYSYQLEGFSVAYGMIAIIFLSQSLRHFNREANAMQKIMPILPVLKLIYCMLNYSYWRICPWFPHSDSANLQRSFKVTMSTLFQTVFCMSFILMALGYKNCRLSLNQFELKKVLIITALQYFVDSLYSIGTYISVLRIFVQYILNIFSLFMIAFVLFESKRNFDALNFRIFVVQQIPQLGYIQEALNKKKRLVSLTALTIIAYFLNELFIHGLLDMYFQWNHIRVNLQVGFFHEIVDFSVILTMLIIVTLSAKNHRILGSGIIDTSNLDFGEELNRARASVLLKCSIDHSSNQDEPNEFKYNLRNGMPVVIVNPDNEDPLYQIGYLDEKPDKDPEYIIEETIVEETEKVDLLQQQ